MTNTLKVTVCGAENLHSRKRNGPFRPVATVWVQKNNRYRTSVNENGDRYPIWNETLSIPFAGRIDKNTTLEITIFDSRRDGNEKKIGSAKLKLWKVVKEVGCGKPARRTLELKRCLWMSHGYVVVEVLIEMPDTAQPDGQPPGRTEGFLERFLRGVAVGVGLSDNVPEGLEGLFG